VTKQGYSRSLNGICGTRWEDRMFDKTNNCQGYTALLRK
jgi:hypothetical protein